jgi:bifunctional UDP-N-acetylglucosamine pyrophosphorylase/glucosamine-1-phosphate N-acetyltransferase
MNIVILAAGQGKRMRSTLPKVLHPIAGKPMLGWVLDTASALDPKANVVVVVGHGSSQVESYLDSISSAAQIVVQKEQKGTGHAVLQAVPALRSDDQTLILYGDVPLISASTLQKLALLAQQGSLGLLTEFMDDPTGYGRIVRNADTTVAAIVEEKDASPELRAIREVNTGLMIAPTATLKTWLSGLSANNAQQEYYLTVFMGNSGRQQQKAVGRLGVCLAKSFSPSSLGARGDCDGSPPN